MAKQTIPTGTAPNLTISAYGNLRVSGWDRAEISLQSTGGSPPGVLHQGEQVALTCPTDSVVDVPRAAAIHIETVHGNVTLSALDGELHITQVGANLSLQQVGPIRMDIIRGNLLAENVRGDLEAGAIYGNATLLEVVGSLTVEEAIRGNLILSRAQGVSAQVLGTARLDLEPEPGGEYSVAAQGNIDCQLSPGASVSVDLSSRVASIQVDVPGRTETLQSDTHAFTLGDGAAVLKLSAGGRIHLTAPAADGDAWPEDRDELDEHFKGVTDEIGQHIELEMERLESQLNERLAHLSGIAGTTGISSEEVDGIVRHARQTSLRAAQRARSQAQKAAQRAQEKLSRRLEKARRKAGKRARAGAYRSADSPRSGGHEWSGRTTEPAGPSAAQEEARMILQMLEKNQISVEEANQLLEALEGRGGGE